MRLPTGDSSRDNSSFPNAGDLGRAPSRAAAARLQPPTAAPVCYAWVWHPRRRRPGGATRRRRHRARARSSASAYRWSARTVTGSCRPSLRLLVKCLSKHACTLKLWSNLVGYADVTRTGIPRATGRLDSPWSSKSGLELPQVCPPDAIRSGTRGPVKDSYAGHPRSDQRGR